MSDSTASVLFTVTAAIAAIASLLVVTRKNPVYAALFLVLVFACIAGEFFLLGAEFLGFMQLLVYAGAIMVLYVFVIMLINPRKETLPEEGGITDRLVAGVVAAAVLGLLCYTIHASEKLRGLATFTAPGSQLPAGHGQASSLGIELFRDHLLVFEVTSVLIFIAIVGAVHLALRPLRKGSGSAPDTFPRRLERTVTEEHAHV